MLSLSLSFVDVMRLGSIIGTSSGYVLSLSHTHALRMAPKRGSAAVHWEWQDDDGSFKSFEEKFEAVVEGKYQAALTTPGASHVVHIDYAGGWKYDFDFDKMTQTNSDSGKMRSVRRSGPALSVAAYGGGSTVTSGKIPMAPTWKWEDDKEGWHPFSAENTAALEAAYHTVPLGNPTTTVHAPIPSGGSQAYHIDFRSMTQTNTSSKKVRKIRRIPNGHPSRDFGSGTVATTVSTDEPPAKKHKTEEAPSVSGVSAAASTLPPLAAEPPKSAHDAGKSAAAGSAVTKVIKKGHGVVDPHSGMSESCHVYESGKIVYQCMLNQTNIDQNNNKFYVIQLLEEDKGGKFYLFTRWGRVGVVGQSALDHFTSVGPAIMMFKKKFRDKTSNDWDNVDSFVKIPGKYQLMAIDLGGDEESAAASKASIGEHLESGGGEVVPSKLPPQLQSLVKMICNKSDMVASMKELEIDTNKMPLGKISKKQIKEAFGHLKDIEAELKKASPNHTTLMNLTSMFYTLIPHDFGMTVPPIIKTPEMLKRKMELLDILGDLEIASKLLAVAKKSGVHPIDQAYDSLSCSLAPLDHNSPEFLRVAEYVKNTHGKTHTAYRLQVMEVFAVKRAGEELRYKAYEGLHNKQMLWHGSRTTNFMGILSQGLRIAPPEAPVTGYMFGKGVYFADCCSKSANYCNATPAANVGCLLLCEVALGTTKDLTAAMYMDKPQPGTNSTKGVGRMRPDDAHSVVVDGVKWPLGRMIDDPAVSHTSLLYPEYIVYDVAQCKMKYLVQLKFEFGKK